MRLAVVGATGLVGREIIRVLEEGDIPLEAFYPVASQKSIGSPIEFKGKTYKVLDHTDVIALKPHAAIFSAGAGTSKEWAPKYAGAGITVIDNSSAWRMDNDIPLVVPEINAGMLDSTHKIIANPNCSTIQLVLVLAPLHQKYRIRRIVVSTYQSVTGTGIRAVRQLENERMGIKGDMAYPHRIDMNLFPHGGTFLPNGYTTEEEKLVNETRKILNDQSIQVTATVVRVPVTGGHSESVNIEFENDFNIEDVLSLLASTPGIVIQDNPSENLYPMPLYSKGRNEVFVGRIRRDQSQPKSLNLWVVADNLRKGAATNAVQIATCLFGGS
ncbi:MAG: aspartate-semialdehyde dehydrogenase [Bacteroidota bacterium]